MMNRFNRIALFAVLAALFAFGAVFAPISEAAEEEVRIELIIGFGAGGSTDLAARYMAEALREHGIVANIVNMAGGMGTIAAAHVAEQSPDSNMFLWGAAITLIFEPAIGDRGFTIDDFDAVGMLASPTFSIAARGDAPFKTWEEMLEYMKANPGKVSVGGQGEGSMMHFYMTKMIDQDEYDYNYTAFAGGADVSLNLTGGHIDVGHLSLAAASPLHAEGNLTVLINTQVLQERDPLMPDVPNIREKGIDAAEPHMMCLFAPKGTDPELIQRITKAMEKASRNETLIENYRNTGMLAHYLSPEDTWALFMRLQEEIVPQFQEWHKTF